MDLHLCWPIFCVRGSRDHDILLVLIAISEGCFHATFAKSGMCVGSHGKGTFVKVYRVRLKGCVNSPPPRNQREPLGGIHATWGTPYGRSLYKPIHITSLH